MTKTLKTVSLAAAALFLTLPAMAATQSKHHKAAEAKPMAAAAKAPEAKELVDVNSATVEQLEAIPAIGKTYAAKIVAGRPYKTVGDLSSKKIVPASVFSKIEHELTVK